MTLTNQAGVVTNNLFLSSYAGGGQFDASTGSYTVPAAGWYLFDAQVVILQQICTTCTSTLTLARPAGVALYGAGTVQVQQTQSVGALSLACRCSLHVSATRWCAAGDVVVVSLTSSNTLLIGGVTANVLERGIFAVSRLTSVQ